MTLRSETINELAAALAKAQGQMTNAVADKTNPHFKSKYADLPSVIDSVRKPLSDNGLAPVQQIDGPLLRTMLMHTSGQWIASEFPLPLAGRPQEIGSVLTYWRRYSLAALVCTAAEDDDANEGQGQKITMRRPAPPAPNPMADTPQAPLTAGSTAPADNANPAPPVAGAVPTDEDRATINQGLTDASQRGTIALRQAWEAVPAEWRPTFRIALDQVYKPAAQQADKTAGP